MANMSYCRFENTNKDLGDCEDALELFLGGDTEEISKEERKYAARLIEKCLNILILVAEVHGSTLGDFCDAHDHNMEEAALELLNDEADDRDDDE